MRSAKARSAVWELPLTEFPSLKDFVFQPSTDWQGLFQGWFSPHITFGANTEDKPVEAHVLDTVGSYGSQINRIMDAMSVLVSRLDPKELTPQEQFTVSKFKELAFLTDKAAAEFQGKPYHESVTLAEVAGWLDSIDDLKKSNPAAYARIASVIMGRLGESVGQP
jgi:hypothetical protein